MKIAVAAQTENENSELSPVSGRAHYFLIFEDKQFVKAIKNPFLMGGGGVAFSVAQLLSNEGVEVIVGQMFGGNMQTIMEQKNIKIKIVKGKTAIQAVNDVVEEEVENTNKTGGEQPMPRGEGMGRGGPRQGLGPAMKCKCSSCGYEMPHSPGTPCINYTCPKCGAKMIGAD